MRRGPGNGWTPTLKGAVWTCLPLKIPLRGSNLLQPAARCSEYEARMTLGKVESFDFGPEGAQEKIYCFGASFGKDDKWLNLLMVRP